MASLSLALWVGNAALLAAVEEALRGLPLRVSTEKLSPAAPASLVAEVARLKPDALLLDLTVTAGPLEETVRLVLAASPGTLVIALHTEPDPDAILSAMRAGAGEFLYPPLEASLAQALERRAGQGRATSGRRGRLLGLLSVKGGCGATTLACHLGAELGRLAAAREQIALLADFDLDAGIVGFLMKARSAYSILNAFQNLHRLDVSYWRGLISNGWPGLEVIAAPPAAAPHQTVRKENIGQLLTFLRAHYDWVVADLGRSLNEIAEAAIDHLDDLLLVSTLEVPAMHQAKQVIQGLLNRGYGREHMRMILNRTPQQRPAMSTEEIERILGLPVFGVLPNDAGPLDDCYCEGRLLPAASNLGRQIARLALQIAGIPEEKRRRRFLGFG